ncbi:MAG: YccF domain-containing protein [Caulobacteraceae bacterium]|nr:YccF domain-containing protein [Caulobacteraceae bacterium]
MALVLNVLWFIFGGFAVGIAWVIGGCVLAITIVGLPWVPSVFRIAVFSFAPFGRQVVDRAWVTGRGEPGGGTLGLLLNVVWLVFAGWYIALAHLVVGVAQCVTLIGIPFGIQHFKLAGIALAPVGKTIVPA